MDREYPPGTLARVQQIETNMLEAVDRICRKHGLTYWIDGGTCLGAVRHKGFIPWDDDIDVGMPMEDFLRFEELAKTELPEGMSLHIMKSDPTQYVLWGKLYQEKTTFIESDAEQAGCDECVFIDVFPYIRLDERRGDHGVGHLRRTQFWTKLIYIYRIIISIRLECTFRLLIQILSVNQENRLFNGRDIHKKIPCCFI